MMHVSGNSWRQSPNRADDSHVTRWIFIGCGCFCPEHLIPPQLSHIYLRNVTPPNSLPAACTPAIAHNVAVSVVPLESTGGTETPMVFAQQLSESAVGNQLGFVAPSQSEPSSLIFEDLPMTPAENFSPFPFDLSQGRQDNLTPQPQFQDSAMQADPSCPLPLSPTSAQITLVHAGYFYLII